MHALTKLRNRAFYLALGCLMGLIAISGFWPTYFGPLLSGNQQQPVLIHFLTMVFVGWLLIFTAQVFFAATQQLAMHMRLGKLAIGYGMFMIFIGLYTAIARSAEKGPGEDAALLYNSFADMVIFAIFFFSAIIYRRKPQMHKRLMIVAATMLLIAPVSRLWFLPEFPSGIPIFLGIWFLPVLLAIGYDFFGERKIHPIYIAGLTAFFARVFSIQPVVSSHAWLNTTEFMLSMYRGV